MNYMRLISVYEEVVRQTIGEEYDMESVQVTHRPKSREQRVTSSPLHPTWAAHRVRARQDNTLVTDGPFAETREQLGG